MRLALVMTLACLAVLLAACVGGGRQPMGLGQKLGAEGGRSELALDAELSDYTIRFISSVEQALGDIYLKSRDRAMKTRALIAALRMNEQVVRASSHQDPVIAMIDLWVLTAQMRYFFLEGDGRDWFGDDQEVIVDSLTSLEFAVAKIGNSYLGKEREATDDPASARGPLIEELVRASPVEGDAMMRRSVAIDAADFIGDKPRPDLFGTMASLDANTRDITTRLNVLTMMLPRSLIYRVDLLIQDNLESLEQGPIMEKLDRAVTVAEELPDVIERERAAAFESIDQQREDTLADVDRQRTETFELIDRQRTDTLVSFESLRKNTFDDLDAMRVDTMDHVASAFDEAKAVFEAQSRELVITIDSELDKTIGTAMDSIEEVRVASFADGDAMLEATVDRFFWRALVLIAAAVVGGATLVVLAHLLRMRRLRVTTGAS